jgi:hypothetical protein
VPPLRATTSLGEYGLVDDVWVAAGAPLDGGAGWRVWYSWRGGGPFAPAPVTVRLPGGPPEPLTPDPDPHLIDVEGSERSFAVHKLQLQNPSPGTRYQVDIPEAPGPPLVWRTLPDRLPPQGLRFLLSSCFWINDDRDGAFAAGIRELVRRHDISFKFMTGDQLYLDVPLHLKPTNPRERFIRRYGEYWGDELFRDVLLRCPTMVTSDDHEYWNDFPRRQAQVAVTWTRKLRDESERAARDLYAAFQTALNPEAKPWFELDLPPVSFFVSDSRSERTDIKGPSPRTMSAEQWDAMDAWVARLTGPGLLVLSQPLFKEGGSPTDTTLVDFPDITRLASVFEAALTGRTGDRKPHDLLILTGDIHTGRLSRGVAVNLPDTRAVYEFVASPASRVTPHLPPWGQKPSELPGRLKVAGQTWEIAERAHAPTVDNHVGLVSLTPFANRRVRVQLQLWHVRPYVRWSPRQAFRRSPRPTTDIRPIHDPFELELV